MDELFTAIREACSPAVWSRGVELVRAGAVVGERAEAREVELRVSSRTSAVAPAVTLYLEDEDWSCECSSHEDVCVHVAAAAIALRQARQQGKSLPGEDASRPAARLRYRFQREGAGLAFERLLVVGDEARPLGATLTVLAKATTGPKLVATPQDLELEVALGSRGRGVLPRELMRRVLSLLVDAPDVRLDDAPVRAAEPSPGMRARVEDCAEGCRVRLEQDPQVSEIFANGVLRYGDTLRPLDEVGLSARELEDLRRGKVYPASAIADLANDLLPRLRLAMPVVVETTRLPASERMRPRASLETAREGEALTVLATIVYGDPPVARVDGERLHHFGGAVPIRDLKAEARLVRRLEEELGLVPGIRRRFTAEAAVAFVARLRDWEEGLRGSAHEAFFLAPPLVPRLRLDGAKLDLDFESVAGEQEGGRVVGRAAGDQVLAAWRQGASLVPLLDGGFAPLPADFMSRLGDRLADLLAARDAEGKLPRAALIDLGRLCEAMDAPAPPELGALRAVAQDFAGIPEAPRPADLTATLRPYQQRGVDWLCFMREAGLGAVLADDMGLGKTLQALCAVRGRTLIVAPTSVLHNWSAEIARFRPALRQCIYHGPARRLDPAADVMLTTYAILRLDEAELARQRWDTAILDEAQLIKNPDSQVARAAYALQAGFKITLSGTPVENRLEELWSQLHFTNPGLLGGRGDFLERYVKPIADGEAGVALRLRERIKPFVLRRMKREVAPELPPRTDVVLRCELSDAERRVYDAVRAASLAQVVEKLNAGGGVMEALEMLLRLRQASCHAGLVPGQEADGSSKVELLLERLDGVVADGHKALVFSQWTSLLDRVEPHLRRAGIAFLRLDGSTPDRAEVVRRFQAAEGPPVLLVSLKAGGTGLNLTAADHVFLLDLWWNPAVEDQAADRAHRIGQERPVMVYRLVAEATVEERILALQEHKRALAESVLGDAAQAAALTREDLLNLLS